MFTSIFAEEKKINIICNNDVKGTYILRSFNNSVFVEYVHVLIDKNKQPLNIINVQKKP